MGIKATGIVRQVDELGRIVLPIEIRKKMGINQKDPLEIYVDDDSIILKKYQSGCIFCDNARADDIVIFHGKRVCKNCIHELQR